MGNKFGSYFHLVLILFLLFICIVCLYLPPLLFGFHEATNAYNLHNIVLYLMFAG